MRITLVSFMLNAAFVVMRELVELLLIGLAVLGCAGRELRVSLRKLVVIATMAGVFLGCLFAAFLGGDEVDRRLEAGCAVLLGAATLWMSLTILFSKRSVQAYVEDTLGALSGSRTAIATVTGFCLFAGFRESVEVWMFLGQAADRSDPLEIAQGAFIGVGVLTLGLLAFRPLVLGMPWQTLYRLSTLCLCFMSVKLLLGGGADLLGHISHAGSNVWVTFMHEHLTEVLRATATAFLVTLAPIAILAKRWWTETSIR